MKTTTSTEAVALSTRATAAAIGVGMSTLKRWRASGTGPAFVRLEGGHIRYLPADVEAWLRARRVTPLT